MSDPALVTGFEQTEYTTIESVPLDRSGVYLFDFDGVIASGVEDYIYKLDERPGERKLFSKIEARLGLRISDMEFRYRRHLLFQELAAARGLPIPTGAGYEVAKWASGNARFFVLTARSGWAATARVREFLNTHRLKPIDLYQVGRVHKDRQVKRTVEEFPLARVYYVEDSLAHLERSASLNLPSLTPVHCSEEIEIQGVEALYQEIFSIEAADEYQ